MSQSAVALLKHICLQQCLKMFVAVQCPYRPRGRLFQIRGPTALKLLSPKLLCVRGTAHMLSEEDRRDRRSETRCMSSAR